MVNLNHMIQKILLVPLLLLLMQVKSQITKQFGQQVKALIEAEASELLSNEIESNSHFTAYRTVLKLDHFDVQYIVSGLGGAALLADYNGSINEELMDDIDAQLNIMGYLVSDSQYSSGNLSPDKAAPRQIVARDSSSGKTLLKIKMLQNGAIHFDFIRH